MKSSININWRRTAQLLAAIATTAMLAVSGTTAANANTPAIVIPEDALQELTSVWTEHGVTAASQELLITKLEGGQPLDSYGLSEPVSQTTAVNGGFETVVSTFPDGSIAVSEVQIPSASVSAGGVAARGVQGCTKTKLNTTTWSWKECTAHWWAGGVQLAFLFNGTARSNGGTKITGWGTKTIQCILLTCNEPQFELIRQTQSGSNRAQLNLVTFWVAYNGLSSGTARMALYGDYESFYTN